MHVLLKEIDHIRDQQTDIQSQVGRLQAAKENHEKNLRKRYEKMVEIGQNYGLGDLVSQISQHSQDTPGLSQDASFFSTAHGSQADNSTILRSPQGPRGQSQQQPVLDISPEDMNEYFRAVQRKKEELQEQQSQHKSKKKEQEDQLNNEISDLKGKCKALESNKDRVQKEYTKVHKEISDIRNSANNGKCTFVGSLERSVLHT
jgi:predicted  nucleic acid-binding Zn-ribbon protein